jgi:DNA primase
VTDLDTLKQMLPIELVVGEYVQLRKAGSTYKGLCPFHSEKTPSFTVSPERSSYRCFGCGKYGDVVSFVMEIEKIDFKDALSRLARKAGIELTMDRPAPVDPEAEHTFALNEAASIFFQSALASPGGQAARDYLAQRGVTSQSFERFGLGWAPAGWDGLLTYLSSRGHDAGVVGRAGLAIHHAESGRTYDRFRNRLMFPIRDAKGRLTGFGGRELDGSQPKYMNSPQTNVFDKGGVLYLLDQAYDSAHKQGRLVVVEGYMDALIAHQAGFDNVVASLGTALTDKQLRLIQRAAKTVVVALDADSAGQRAIEQTVALADQVFERLRAPALTSYVPSERSPGRTVAVMPITLCVAALPDGKDPDEVIRESPEQWAALVEAALPIMEFLFQRVMNIPGNARRTEQANLHLLRVLAQLPDPLERGHYVDRLATALGVPESNVLSAMAAVRNRPNNSTLRAAERTESDAATSTPTGAMPNASELESDDNPPTPRRSAASPVWDSLSTRQRHVLSMLLRYPRLIGSYREALAGLEPQSARLALAWSFVLEHPEAQLYQDFAALLPDGETLTPGYLDALLNDTSTIPPLDLARQHADMDSAIDLLKGEHLRLRIVGAQERLRAASEADDDIRAELAALTTEKAALAAKR